MICLDANFLIGGVIEARPESRHLLAWAAAGETFCTAAPAWYEFLCGPVTPAQIETMQAFLKGASSPSQPLRPRLLPNFLMQQNARDACG